eukprot:TRINITY_DN65229_c0_g1_i1.p1 TRINITY_DN65229_c0_g1~~TRINITY_DN65229_c0_g1_i1.p1  ORF type:complete len:1163 (+),score=322.79 TRINITY_DN65229_c0_g1_i1:156-3644(+)
MRLLSSGPGSGKALTKQQGQQHGQHAPLPLQRPVSQGEGAQTARVSTFTGRKVRSSRGPPAPGRGLQKLSPVRSGKRLVSNSCPVGWASSSTFASVAATDVFSTTSRPATSGGAEVGIRWTALPGHVGQFGVRPSTTGRIMAGGRLEAFEPGGKASSQRGPADMPFWLCEDYWAEGGGWSQSDFVQIQGQLSSSSTESRLKKKNLGGPSSIAETVSRLRRRPRGLEPLEAVQPEGGNPQIMGAAAEGGLQGQAGFPDSARQLQVGGSSSSSTRPPTVGPLDVQPPPSVPTSNYAGRVYGKKRAEQDGSKGVPEPIKERKAWGAPVRRKRSELQKRVRSRPSGGRPREASSGVESQDSGDGVEDCEEGVVIGGVVVTMNSARNSTKTMVASCKKLPKTKKEPDLEVQPVHVTKTDEEEKKPADAKHQKSPAGKKLHANPAERDIIATPDKAASPTGDGSPMDAPASLHSTSVGDLTGAFSRTETEEKRLEEKNASQKKEPDEIWSDVFRKLGHDNFIHRDELPRALMHCGISHPMEEWISKVLSDITDHSAINEVEFIRFVGSYIGLQTESYGVAFRECDADGSGYVEADELAELLKNLGVEPMRHVLDEVIQEVDEDGAGSLDLHEFMLLMNLIRERECFTKQEYEDFMLVFKRFDVSNAGELATEEVVHLLHWLGYTLDKDDAEEIVSTVDVDGGGTLDVREFLMCMRKVREEEVETVKNAFAHCDADGSGTISGAEMDATLRVLGYITHPQAVTDAMLDCRLEPDCELDLSDFFKVLQVYRQREGLCNEDIADVEMAFQQYNRDEHGELSTLDVGKLLRRLGFNPSFEQQQRYVYRVDADRSGNLNLLELRKLIRLVLDEETEVLRMAFDEMDTATRSRGLITLEDADRILAGLQFPGGLNPVLEALPEELTISAAHGYQKRINFLQFVRIMGRALRTARRIFREDGGFTKPEIEALKEQFRHFDVDDSGDICNCELIRVIESLFPKVAHSPAMRPKLVALLMEVDQDGDGSLDFSDFVRLMRQFRDLENREFAAKEEKVIEDTGFAVSEVKELRELFVTACTASGTPAKGGRAQGDRRPSAVGMGLGLEGLKEMLAQICPLGDKNATHLASIFGEVTGGQSEADFSEFMTLIKKLLDMDFAGIKQRTQIQADPKPLKPE